MRCQDWRCSQLCMLEMQADPDSKGCFLDPESANFSVSTELTSNLFNSSSKKLHLPSDSFSDSGMAGERGFVVTAKGNVESNGKWVPIRKGSFTHMVKVEAENNWRDTYDDRLPKHSLVTTTQTSQSHICSVLYRNRLNKLPAINTDINTNRKFHNILKV